MASGILGNRFRGVHDQDLATLIDLKTPRKGRRTEARQILEKT
jgi:hypothetical protein